MTRRGWYTRPYVLLTAFSGLFLLASWVAGLTGAEAAAAWLAIVSMLAGAWYAVQAAGSSLSSRELDVNVLMLLAAVGAAYIGRFVEGAILIFLFSLSNTLEMFTMARTRDAIRALLKLRPAVARVRTNGGEVEREIGSVDVGELVIVRPGELIPLDGEVMEGEGAVDQAAMTGESVPADKGPGDTVLGGTISLDAPLVVRVTRRERESALAKVIALVAKAQGEKAGGERISHWVGRWYTWVVILGVTAYLLDQVLRHGLPFQAAFYRSVVVLVAASPCALVMATPSAVLSALANCARRGILVRGGKFLEALVGVKVLAFDKTGTLTRGRFEVVDVIPHPRDGREAEDELLRLTAGAEAHSNHPLAVGVVEEARRRGLELPVVQDVKAHSGSGVECSLEGGRLRAGAERLFGPNGGLKPEVVGFLRRLEAEGKTAIAVIYGDRTGVIGLRDTLRETTAEALRQAREAGIESIVMLTGDNETTASIIAREAGVDEFFCSLMPDEKTAKVRKLQASRGAIAMVGDGINDAPALATAAVGIAMGGIGSDVALETADVVLMNDRIERIPDLLRLSRRAMGIVKANLALATASIAMLVALSLSVGVPLPAAVVGHELTTVAVMLNGVRLLGAR